MENKNYMKEVAALLGVELDEHFKIITENGNAMQSEYILYEYGAAQYIKNDDYDEENSRVKGTYYKNIGILTYLLTGEWKIQKIPFKPKDEQEYWTFYVDGYDNISVMNDCSIVSVPYQIGDDEAGMIAVIGPTRMEYSRVIPLLEYIAKNMSKLFK